MTLSLGLVFILREIDKKVLRYIERSRMDLSIIVPVYNTPQKILAQCFSSILSLKDIDFELLIVDDGSLESVGKYCSEFADLHKGCRYLKKENGGVSSARNLGLTEAGGTFVMFVDSDDMLFPKAFHLSDFLGADLIIYDTMMIKGWKTYLNKSMKVHFKNGIKNDTLLTKMIVDGTLGFIHGIVYRKKFLDKNKISFDEKCIQREDADFNFEIVMKNPEIKYLPTVAYMYKYKAANAIKRWKSNPDLMMEIAQKRYERNLKLINEKGIENENLLKDRIIVERTASIYQEAIDLCCARMLTRHRKEKLRNFMYELEHLDSYNQVIRKKYYRIIKNKWYIIRIFSLFRMVYLKISGIY